MFLKKRHLEILKKMKDTNVKNSIEKELPEDFATRILELNILGFVEYTCDKIEFTEAGKRLISIIDEIDVNTIPDVYIDSEIIKIMELLNETGYVPEDWMNLLNDRNLANNGKLSNAGTELLEIYYNTHPIVYITPEILSFIKDMPKIGTYEELIAYKNTKNNGDNIVNALQAMRLLKISPKTDMGKAFSTTNALNEVLKLSKMIPSFSGALILKKEDFDALKKGDSTKYADEMEYFKDGKITPIGQKMVDIYSEIGTCSRYALPIFVLDDEIKVLKTISQIEEIYSTNPDILPTYNEIHKRGNIDNLGELLHLLESKELIKLEVVKNKDTYWITEFGKTVKDYGSVSTDGMKAITYSKSGDVPIAEWVIAGKNEGVINRGLTEKGKFLYNMSKSIVRKPYLTRYDISLLIKMPNKEPYIHKKELINKIKNQVGGNTTDIVKSIGECESKGFIIELQNKEIKLTNLGRNIKTAIEMGKINELLSTKFAITPTTFNILQTIYNHKSEFDKIWKEKSEGKIKENEIILLAKYLKLTPDVIKKSLIILKNTGLLGDKGLTDAGKRLVEAYQ